MTVVWHRVAQICPRLEVIGARHLNVHSARVRNKLGGIAVEGAVGGSNDGGIGEVAIEGRAGPCYYGLRSGGRVHLWVAAGADRSVESVARSEPPVQAIVVTDAATTTAATVLFNSANASRQDRSPTAQRRIVTAPTMTNNAPKSTSGPSHQSI
jgi:hypothetical protein